MKTTLRKEECPSRQTGLSGLMTTVGDGVLGFDDGHEYSEGLGFGLKTTLRKKKSIPIEVDGVLGFDPGRRRGVRVCGGRVTSLAAAELHITFCFSHSLK